MLFEIFIPHPALHTPLLRLMCSPSHNANINGGSAWTHGAAISILLQERNSQRANKDSVGSDWTESQARTNMLKVKEEFSQSSVLIRAHRWQARSHCILTGSKHVHRLCGDIWSACRGSEIGNGNPCATILSTIRQNSIIRGASGWLRFGARPGPLLLCSMENAPRVQIWGQETRNKPT